MLGLRDLNRTLLARQHLLERVELPALDMVAHVVGLQGQDNLPPYLALAARIEGFDPHELSAAIESRAAVRLLSMRGTIHVLVPDDELALRPWVQPALDQASRSNPQNVPARGVPGADVVDATRRLLSDGPLSVKELGERLAEAFPGVPGSALVATAADMTTWSRVTRLGRVFTSMADELEGVECADGRRRYDVPGAPRIGGDAPAPVRLLGTYDNLWLSHADRSHVLPDDVRTRWMGANGGNGHAVFVDGFMAGL